jgi:hypothetical protein
MENPAFRLTVTITRPTPQTQIWSETEEGMTYSSIFASLFNAYGNDKVDMMTTNSEDKLMTTLVVNYSSREIYEEIRLQALEILPDFYQKRDEYSAPRGIMFTYNTEELT